MELHFGQVVIPYSNGQLSSDVARYLENDYGLTEVFVKTKKQLIEQQYILAILDMLNDAIHGVPIHPDKNIAFGKVNTATTQMRRDMLNKREYDGLIHGVPTLRAEMGVSLRFKSGFTTAKVKGKKIRISRPSFIDTHLYLNSMITWLE